MFGTLRLILAILVVAAHSEVPHQINLGVSAVVIFFLLSGFVMTATVRRYYSHWSDYGSFMLDRAARILPQYFFWLALALGWVAFFAAKPKPLGMQPVLENVALVPLMFVVYDLRPRVSGVVYLSQSWSLSLEWYFYMALPVLLFLKRGRMVGFALSFIVASLAALNVINPYRHGYHLLPGVLFIFLIGSIIFEECRGSGGAPRTIGAFVLVLALGAAANAHQSLQYEWTREVLVGLMAGIPLVFLLGRLPPHGIDTTLGNLSYGVFLNHYIILDPIYQYRLIKNPWGILAATVALSLPLSWLSYRLVEAPVLHFRRRLRDQRTRTRPGYSEKELAAGSGQ